VSRLLPAAPVDQQSEDPVQAGGSECRCRIDYGVNALPTRLVQHYRLERKHVFAGRIDCHLHPAVVLAAEHLDADKVGRKTPIRIDHGLIELEIVRVTVHQQYLASVIVGLFRQGFEEIRVAVVCIQRVQELFRVTAAAQREREVDVGLYVNQDAGIVMASGLLECVLQPDRILRVAYLVFHRCGVAIVPAALGLFVTLVFRHHQAVVAAHYIHGNEFHVVADKSAVFAVHLARCALALHLDRMPVLGRFLVAKIHAQVAQPLDRNITTVVRAMTIGPLVITERVEGRRLQALEDILRVLTDGLVGTQAAAVLGVIGKDGEVKAVLVHGVDGLVDHGRLRRRIIFVELIAPQGHFHYAFVAVPLIVVSSLYCKRHDRRYGHCGREYRHPSKVMHVQSPLKSVWYITGRYRPVAESVSGCGGESSQAILHCLDNTVRILCVALQVNVWIGGIPSPSGSTLNGIKGLG